MKKIKIRDLHKLAIIKGEARGYTTAIPSKKAYKRHDKHKKIYKKELSIVSTGNL